MNNFIKNIIYFSLRHRAMVFFLTAVLAVLGVWSYLNTPIETFPDVTNTQIIIIAQWPGRSAEEIEKMVTIPMETVLNSVQKKANLRTTSSFGLSYIRIIFDDDVDDAFARQQVLSRLGNADLPDGVKPEVEPPYGPTGEIYRYTLKSKTKSLHELTAIQDWVLDRQFKAVPGVADVNSFGGEEKTYEVSVNPALLQKYGMTSLDVFNAISRSNINVGGDVIEKNDQAFVVRGIGLINNISEIENIIVKNVKNVPILARNVAEIKESGLPRLGQVGRDKNSDVIEGIVVMRKGENPAEVLTRIRAKVQDLNNNILPKDVKLDTFYDRTTLMDFCTETVIHNLLEGIVLVTVIVFLFMADWRTTLTVAIIIPLALLFAFICMRIKGMTANLLSMGAIDFGIIIDGAVVMVEGIFVALDHRAKELGMEKFNKIAKLGLFKNVGAEMGKAIFFSKLIIITCLIPIFAFQKVEGKMFSPLAYTLGFALLGALIFTLTLVPALSSILLKKNVREKHNPVVLFFENGIRRMFNFTYRNQKLSLIVSVSFMILTFISAKFLGTEFLPQLNEGALWVTAQLPMSTSLENSVNVTNKMRQVLSTFPEVKQTLSQVGRTNDGTDPKGFFNVQIQVDLLPKKEWKSKITQEELIAEMDKKLSQFPGIIFNYSQPIIDNVAEAVAGVPASMAVKVFGPDFKTLDAKADQVMAVLKNIKGVEDLGVLRNLGQPEFRIELDQRKMAVYGVSTADANSVIEMAIGGKAVTQLYEGERKFDIRIRYQKQFRDTQEKIENLMVPTMNGSKISIKEISSITSQTGPAFIYRDNNMRYIAVKFSVRGRDLGGTIAEAQEKVDKAVKLDQGYSFTWNGEFENQIRASNTLARVVPICLLVIFLILYVTFGNAKDAVLVIMNVPFALMGGILALHITHVNFSISAGIGFIALFGVCIQNGVILISVFRKNLEAHMPLNTALLEGVVSRVRPVVMTALMAAIGLMPAALSTGIGSETQKPLAIVVIGGLVTSTILTLLILPVIYAMVYKLIHRRENRKLLKRMGVVSA
ncbi:MULTISPECIES: CusA/CzcA family heavy metal efflux RND transporter [unclassified Mucilaginibacter]|uniref:efflux RND transporter permease subunit n=1 Tax=unclassified Mucilaginibacter TaxID=2617802 RepID=UPI002AC8B4AB|nr:MULTISPECIES: CusA/CzcA family heavy metal efflux RND transporter [unclassified Mucilaginibacter]MEB0261609.1 CusA/CzcA family heavy metal efflux RND transporter [Mucilaginibacter sp. 10I4]MEB0277137.1 CusA/CzcA family heavy metal efflux RND transporter [Mucilaginibacter sp. 10B2]MEB0301417.1 CusA/CzcA family heavy metal efflux RND transporter [Mucilaginibacter sp. 5C4]WPX25237.1 CusA/CzcA family heavy metal efflux RND transporter [Mucilaginibacter sp. 5C4]